MFLSRFASSYVFIVFTKLLKTQKKFRPYFRGTFISRIFLQTLVQRLSEYKFDQECVTNLHRLPVSNSLVEQHAERFFDFSG